MDQWQGGRKFSANMLLGQFQTTASTAFDQLSWCMRPVQFVIVSRDLAFQVRYVNLVVDLWLMARLKSQKSVQEISEQYCVAVPQTPFASLAYLRLPAWIASI